MMMIDMNEWEKEGPEYHMLMIMVMKQKIKKNKKKQ